MTIASKVFLKNKIGLYATPTIIHIEKGSIVSGQVGTGGTAQELYDKVFPSVSTEPTSKEPTASQEEITPTSTSQETTVMPSPKKEDSVQTTEQKPLSSVQKENFVSKLIHKALSWVKRLWAAL